jgi:hypothetical protein
MSLLKKPLTLKKALLLVFVAFGSLLVMWLLYILINLAFLSKEAVCSPELNGGQQNACANH